METDDSTNQISESGQTAPPRQDIETDELTNNLNGISGLGVICRISFDRKLRMSDMKEILDIVMQEVDQRLFQA